MACQATLAKEVAGSQNSDDRLFTTFADDRELHAARLQIHYALSGITLRVDCLCAFKLFNLFRHTGGSEEGLGVEPDFLTGNRLGLLICGILD